jgi:hypothetical protein
MRSIAQYVLLCLLLSSLRAQTISAGDGADTPGKWALQLKMPDLISSSPDWNGDIGSIYLLLEVSPRAALRMGANLVLQTPNEPHWHSAYDRHFASDATGIMISDIPTRLRKVTFKVHCLGYAPPSGKATLYFGGGPIFSISREHKGPNFYNWRTMTMWSLGVEGVLGISVLIKPRFRLLAEYNIWYADQFYMHKYSNDGEIRTWAYSEKVRQTIPRSAIPLVGVSFIFK